MSGGFSFVNAVAQVSGGLRDTRGIAYVHVRSARNNCYQLKVERA